MPSRRCGLEGLKSRFGGLWITRALDCGDGDGKRVETEVSSSAPAPWLYRDVPVSKKQPFCCVDDPAGPDPICARSQRPKILPTFTPTPTHVLESSSTLRSRATLASGGAGGLGRTSLIGPAGPGRAAAADRARGDGAREVARTWGRSARQGSRTRSNGKARPGRLDVASQAPRASGTPGCSPSSAARPRGSGDRGFARLRSAASEPKAQEARAGAQPPPMGLLS